MLGGLSISSQYWLMLMPFSLAILWAFSNYKIANFIWGFTFVAISHYWLIHLHPLTWMGFGWVSSLLFAVFAWIGCSAFGGTLVFLWGLILRICIGNLDNLFSKTIIQIALKVLFLSCLWAIGELILTQTPFFWIGISDSLVSGDLYLAGLARWIGASGLCVLQLIFGFWYYSIFYNFKNKKNLFNCIFYGLLLNLIFHLLGYFLILPDVENDSRYPIAIWQSNIPTREKIFQDNQKLTEDIFSLQNKAQEFNAKLLILPEGTLRSNFSFIGKSKMNTLAGGFRFASNNLRNSLLAFSKGDQYYSSFLDKYRLVPLGEKIPNFISRFSNAVSTFGGLESGQRSRLFQWTESPNLALAICYEIVDGIGIKEAVKNGAELILSIANLDPYPETIHSQFLALARMRSIENARDTVIVANTGPSALIRADGRISELIAPNMEQFEIFYPLLATKQTFFSNFGNLPLILIFIFLIYLNFMNYPEDLIKPPPSNISPL